MEYLEKMLADEWETAMGQALRGEDADGVTVLTDFERGKIESGRFTVEHYKSRILKRLEKGYTWKKINKYKRVMALPSKTVNCITIGVDWSKNIYGMQAAATITIVYDDGSREYLRGDRTGGCGYDKRSSAVAYALRESDYMYKLLYEYVNNQMILPAKKRRFSGGMGIFSYGVDNLDYLPFFEYGVGINSTLHTIELIAGLSHETEHETKNSDFYVITK